MFSTVYVIHLVSTSLVLSLDDPVRRSIELLVTLEERKADDEEVLESLTAGLLDEIACSGSRATSSDEVTIVRPLYNPQLTRQQ